MLLVLLAYGCGAPDPKPPETTTTTQTGDTAVGDRQRLDGDHVLRRSLRRLRLRRRPKRVHTVEGDRVFIDVDYNACDDPFCCNTTFDLTDVPSGRWRVRVPEVDRGASGAWVMYPSWLLKKAEGQLAAEPAGPVRLGAGYHTRGGVAVATSTERGVPRRRRPGCRHGRSRRAYLTAC